MTRVALAIVALTLTATAASADRYEASVHFQPSVGVATVGEVSTTERVSVLSLGLGGRFTYGLRHWLAVEGELGITTLGTARFSDVPVTIQGGSAMTADIERTTRTGRVTAAATLRLGVAWIPTVTAGLGGQVRLQGDGRIAGTDLIPDAHDGGAVADAVAFMRVGLDRRINRRLVVGVSIGASHAFVSPAIDSVEVTLSASRFWYPLW